MVVEGYKSGKQAYLFNKVTSTLITFLLQDYATKLFRTWHMYTELPKIHQGPALGFSLEEAQDAALEIPEDETAKESGVQRILCHLGKLFQKNSNTTTYQALEIFEMFKRPGSMSIQQFPNEFEKRLLKTRCYGSFMSEDAYVSRLTH